MTISATTSNAAGISTSIPRDDSSDAASERRRGDPASPATAFETSACAITGPLSCPLRQLSDGFFQQRPRFVAVFALPFVIEPGRTQFFAERREIRLV